jgi:hypothetical protein
LASDRGLGTRLVGRSLKYDTHDFLLEPDNVAPIITFLKKTGIEFTKSLRCDHSDKEETTETEGDDGEIADLEVETFEG